MHDDQTMMMEQHIMDAKHGGAALARYGMVQSEHDTHMAQYGMV
jgi:hypothetical protein